MTDKERYATIGTWIEVFREEGVAISDATIREHLKEAGIIGQTARSKTGSLLRNGFYAESEVRGLLVTLLQGLPQADENGLIEKDGQIYGTIFSLSRKFGISKNPITQRLRSNRLQSIQGRSNIGRVFDFYLLSEVRDLCADLLQDLPWADENGFIEKDGEIYGTVRSLSQALGISLGIVNNRIRSSSLKPIRGKSSTGQLCDFYSTSEVRDLWADLLDEIPQADENGLFEKDGQTWGNVGSLSQAFGISEGAIASRIRSSSLKPIRGKNIRSHLCDFYPLSEVRDLCADLLDEIPQADENGFIEKDGEICGTVKSLSHALGISGLAIKRRIQKSCLQSFQGKTKNGHPRDFYSFSEVRNICANLLGEIPLTNEDGLIEKDGQIYRTVRGLSLALGISHNAINSRIQDSSLKPIKGKNNNIGRVFDFYPLSQVQEICADLISKKSDDR